MAVKNLNKNNSSNYLDDDIMTSTEVADLLRVSVGSVRRWTRDGKLKGYQLGGHGSWRYIRKDVLTFLLGAHNN